MSHNTLFHFLLHKFIPNINSYDDYLRSKMEFIYDENNGNYTDFINCAFTSSFLYKSKMEALNEFQLNQFITKEKKDNLLHYFSLTQKIFYKFKKLYNLYVIKKKVKKYDNDTDLCLTPLNNFKNNISIIQENKIYTFKINDLIRLIIEGITYTYDLFLEPKMPKNPFNNLEFEPHNLYNIYFHILNNTKITQPPILLHLFFKSEFNLDDFLLVNEAYLKDIAIKKYYEDIKNDYVLIYENLSLMLEKSVILSISDDFPQQVVVSNLQHCLLDFLYSEYSYNPTMRRKYKKSLTLKLKDFKSKNPTFGRVIRRINHNAINSMVNRRRRREDFENFLNTMPNSIANNNILSPTNATGTNTQTTNESEPEPIDEILLEAETQVSENTINIEESSDDEDEISFVVDSSNNRSNTNNRLNWTHDIIDTINNEALTRTYSFQYTSTATQIDTENNDNLITSSRFTDNNFFFRDAPIHPITNTIRSSNTNLQINEISNQPYDAYIGPFTSPSNSSTSISPTSSNLNIDNSYDFSNFQN